MSIQRPQLGNDEIYHIVNRGVGDSLIFNNINDYYRGIFSIYEFNNASSVEIRRRREERRKEKASGGLSSAELLVEKRDLLVEILAFCFMPNHIHLLLRQIKDNGITNFMRKVGTGYAYYFNKKHKRKGHLFQNRFKAVHIKTNKQLQNVFVYIHANPISLIEPGWKENGIKNPDEVVKFLNNYKWSSYLDYIGQKNFPSVANRDFLLEIMGGENSCKENINDWIKYKKEIKDFDDIILE